TFTIDAPLDQPKVYEQTIYLKHGGPNFERGFGFRWNMYYPWSGFHDTKGGVVAPDRQLQRLYYGGRGAAIFHTFVLENKEPPAKIEAARKDRDAAAEKYRQFLLTFKGPVYHVRPDVDLNALPRLWYEYIELEGPLAEWPTKAIQELFPQG